jgi:hypothetical protein
MKKKKYPMWHSDMDCLDDEMEKPMYDACMDMDGCTEGMVLAHSYVPWQYYRKAFCPEEALMKGTLFPELWGVYPIPE